jgi:hypothetical protein
LSNGKKLWSGIDYANFHNIFDGISCTGINNTSCTDINISFDGISCTGINNNSFSNISLTRGRSSSVTNGSTDNRGTFHNAVD